MESIRAWKMLLLAINEAYDRDSVDLLLALEDSEGRIYASGDSLPHYSSLVAANLVEVKQYGDPFSGGQSVVQPPISVTLTERGRHLVREWKEGNQREAIEAMPVPRAPDAQQ